MSEESDVIIIKSPDDLVPWWETEDGKRQLLDALNERFMFHKDGTIEDRESEFTT